MSETKPKKMVSRSVAIALGIICIVMVASLVGGFGFFLLVANDKDSTISLLNSQIASLDSQIAFKNSTISALNSQVSDLENQLNSALQEFTIESFMGSTVWVNNQTVIQPAGLVDYSPNWTFSADSVGLVLVTIAAPNETFIPVQGDGSRQTPSLFIEIDYSANGVEHNYHVGIDYTAGTGFFPILPSSNIRVTIGNWDNAHDQTYTITITYYF